MQAAAQNVRLDGDIILQQNDVLHWQAEGAGSLEELRSVCSCACDACIYNPFQRSSERARDSHNPDCANNMIPLTDGNRTSTAMRWYSTDSLRTAATTAVTPGGNYTPNSRSVTPHFRRPKQQQQCDSVPLQQNCDSSNSVTRRAESVHDLRKFEHPLPVMRLRGPRDSRTEMRPKKQLLFTKLEPTEAEEVYTGW